MLRKFLLFFVFNAFFSAYLFARECEKNVYFLFDLDSTLITNLEPKKDYSAVLKDNGLLHKKISFYVSEEDDKSGYIWYKTLDKNKHLMNKVEPIILSKFSDDLFYIEEEVVFRPSMQKLIRNLEKLGGDKVCRHFYITSANSKTRTDYLLKSFKADSQYKIFELLSAKDREKFMIQGEGTNSKKSLVKFRKECAIGCNKSYVVLIDDINSARVELSEYDVDKLVTVKKFLPDMFNKKDLKMDQEDMDKKFIEIKDFIGA